MILSELNAIDEDTKFIIGSSKVLVEEFFSAVEDDNEEGGESVPDVELLVDLWVCVFNETCRCPNLGTVFGYFTYFVGCATSCNLVNL